MHVNDWMNKILARDIMTLDVVKLRPDDSLAEAATILLRENITGAPVIDQFGACQGVLSMVDIFHAEERVARQRDTVARSPFWTTDLALPASVYADKLEEVRDKIAPAAEQPVSRFMSTDLITVESQTPLKNIVRSMVDAHIHRVIVLDSGRCLEGIISSTDVMTALLRAAE